MTTTRFFLLALFSFSVTFSNAMGYKELPKFKKGTVLNKEDIGFLSLVANLDPSQNKGVAKPEVMIGGRSYSEGQTISKSDAKVISKAVIVYQKNNPGLKNTSDDKEGNARGAGWCYYWYWCGSWGTYYKIWYWC